MLFRSLFLLLAFRYMQKLDASKWLFHVKTVLETTVRSQRERGGEREEEEEEGERERERERSEERRVGKECRCRWSRGD